MDSATLTAYNTQAAKLTSSYESANLSTIHALLMRHLSPPPAAILDLGCGSGRDAAFLHARGYAVTALDASPAMLKEITIRHPELAGRLQEKSFPLPPDDPLLAAPFDAVTCFAMLMHVPDHDLFECARQFSLLLKPGGVLIFSVSTGRTGLVDNRDEMGRLYIERPPDQLRQLLEELGFRLLARQEQPDFQGRSLTWTVLVMRKEA